LIADSSAVLDMNRILPQHQSAITLINTMLQNPEQIKLNWLDIACGKGQIISQLSDNISDGNMKKIKYTGYDINHEYTLIAEKIASNLGFDLYRFFHGDLSSFSKIISIDEHFDFITCINTVHELDPKIFSNLLIDSIIRLSNTGELFISDLESLENPELGALSWHGDEIGQLLNVLCEVAGTKYRIHPNIWAHSTCRAWTAVIQRQYFMVSNEMLFEKRNEIISRLDDTIDALLDKRFEECIKILQTYQRCGIATAEEAKLKEQSLYEFWALYNAKEFDK
jgi:SAM-dependent methyltransferase